MAFETDVNKLGMAALAIVSLAVIVGVGAIVLGEMQPASWQTSDTQNEVTTPTTPFPTNYTVTQESSDADFEEITDGSTVVTFEDVDAATNTTLTEDTDYNVYNSDGILEFVNTTNTEDFNDSEDNMYVEYTYEFSGDATSVLTTAINAMQTFADFFTVIVVIAVAAVLFMLLRVVRGAGRGVTA